MWPLINVFHRRPCVRDSHARARSSTSQAIIAFYFRSVLAHVDQSHNTHPTLAVFCNRVGRPCVSERLHSSANVHLSSELLSLFRSRVVSLCRKLTLALFKLIKSLGSASFFLMATMMKPSKHLRYSEQNFAGYWVQLNSVIRHNDQADLILDGLLINPFFQLAEL